MSSPFQTPELHDTFTLLSGTKRLTLPGVARVPAADTLLFRTLLAGIPSDFSS